MADIDHTFTSYRLPYLPGQREAIAKIVTNFLHFAEGKVTAIPLIPGGGKSTVLRSILRVLSRFIAEEVEGILEYIGGVVVVVQTIAEMHTLKAICQAASGEYPICTVIEGFNEDNLKTIGCIAGIATCYEECPREQCERFSECSLMSDTRCMHETPILIISHVRYSWYINSPESLMRWVSFDGTIYQRKVALVDEAPQLTDIKPLDSSFMFALSSDICNPKFFRSPDYNGSLWKRNVLNPFFSLKSEIFHSRPQNVNFGEVTANMLEASKFNGDQFDLTRSVLQDNCKNPLVLRDVLLVMDALSSERKKYYLTNGGETTIFCPKMKEPHGEGKPATFILSGTSYYNPELQENPNITVLDCGFPIDSSRLTVHVQHGNGVRFSKTAAGSARNYAGVLAWVESILNNSREHHELALVMSYQKVAARLYEDLEARHGDWVLPYIAQDGTSSSQLPYFGGTNGSNAYNDSTLFIMAGLNRYRPAAYLNKAIAIASVSERWASMSPDDKVKRARTWIETMQAELLANDIIQAMYRTDLRKHSSAKRIDVWLLMPPGETVEALRRQFPDATFDIIPEFSDEVISAALNHRRYGVNQAHGAAVEQYLRSRLAADSMTPVTPKEIKDGAGLSDEEYNTAMKSPMLKAYLAEHFTRMGRGRNCKYVPHRSTSKNAAS